MSATNNEKLRDFVELLKQEPEIRVALVHLIRQIEAAPEEAFAAAVLADYARRKTPQEIRNNALYTLRGLVSDSLVVSSAFALSKRTGLMEVFAAKACLGVEHFYGTDDLIDVMDVLRMLPAFNTPEILTPGLSKALSLLVCFRWDNDKQCHYEVPDRLCLS